MSRIGKRAIAIPKEVQIEFKDNVLSVKTSKGELTQWIDPRIKLNIKKEEMILERTDEEKETRSLHGLYRSLAANMIEGVTNGFKKQLEIQGVGYRANVSGKKLTLNLGFSHPIEYTAPDGIEFETNKDQKNIITVSGIDKQKVGQVAAEIRSFRKPEPYKGKGIRYVGERIIRKAGKAAAKTEA